MVLRIIFVVLLCFLLFALLRGFYEPHKLDITFTSIGSGDISIKVLLLSDIHAQFYFISDAEIEKAFLTEGLDAVFFTGDLSNDRHDLKKGIKIIKRYQSLASAKGISFYSVLGNHDSMHTLKLLNDAGVPCLRNESVELVSSDGSKWRLIGLDDYRNGNPSYIDSKMIIPVKESIIKANSENVTSDIANLPEIILVHNPESIFGIVKDRNTLDSEFVKAGLGKQVRNVTVLSGHFHGGQIWMPFGIEYYIMRRESMVKKGYRKGCYDMSGINGYISRGLGCVIVPIRFLSLPEAAIIEIHA